jgi:hypothetical protein
VQDKHVRCSLGALAAVLVLSLGLAGCAGMNETQQRTLSGGAIGTAGGAAITAL